MVDICTDKDLVIRVKIKTVDSGLEKIIIIKLDQGDCFF